MPFPSVESAGGMTLQGRLLRVAFADNLVCELGKLIVPPATFKLTCERDMDLPYARLYNIYDCMGERVLKDLGPPVDPKFGRCVSEMWVNPGFWASNTSDV